MHRLTLDAASTIVDRALAKGREMALPPLTVVVLDAGGHMVAMKREDGSSLLRPDIAGGKAWGTLGMGFGGRELARRAAAGGMRGVLFSGWDGRMVPVPGGVLIRNADGEIVGAVGISGASSLDDEACAVAGIDAAGLVADTGESEEDD
ncbi:MAG: heme-binding protein [Acetobacterales bacterium]